MNGSRDLNVNKCVYLGTFDYTFEISKLLNYSDLSHPDSAKLHCLDVAEGTSFYQYVRIFKYVRMPKFEGYINHTLEWLTRWFWVN